MRTRTTHIHGPHVPVAEIVACVCLAAVEANCKVRSDAHARAHAYTQTEQTHLYHNLHSLRCMRRWRTHQIDTEAKRWATSTPSRKIRCEQNETLCTQSDETA